MGVFDSQSLGIGGRVSLLVVTRYAQVAQANADHGLTKIQWAIELVFSLSQPSNSRKRSEEEGERKQEEERKSPSGQMKHLWQDPLCLN